MSGNKATESFENKNKDFVQNLSGILLGLLITISCNDYSQLLRLETPEYTLLGNIRGTQCLQNLHEDIQKVFGYYEN